MSKTVKCQAKDPSTCRVHGTQPTLLNASVLHGSNAYYDLADKTKNLQYFINTAAEEKELTFEQFTKVTTEIRDQQWYQDITAEGYERATAKYYETGDIRDQAKLKMIEEARTEFENQHPEIHAPIAAFNNTVEKYGIETIKPIELKGNKAKLKELYTRLNELPAGSKFAIEFYDGSRLVRTAEKQESFFNSMFSKGFVTRQTASVPPLDGVRNINYDHIGLSLGRAELGARLNNIKTITFLKPGTPDTFPDAGKPAPAKSHDQDSGYYQIKSSHTEGVFYQDKPTKFSGSKVYNYSSANNVYDFVEDFKITKLS